MAISLVKGQKIDLKKSDDTTLSRVCVGLNWGAIEKRGLLGTRAIPVDLDASCALFDASNNLLDVVYFQQLRSRDGAIQHSGDDLNGDVGGDDGLDNEVIDVNLKRLSANVHQVVFFLNSFRKQDFATVPFATIRIYEGTPKKVDSVFATYDIASDPKFAGHVSMVMGKVYRRDGVWRFSAIGEPTKDRDLRGTVKTISKRHL